MIAIKLLFLVKQNVNLFSKERSLSVIILSVMLSDAYNNNRSLSAAKKKKKSTFNGCTLMVRSCPKELHCSLFSLLLAAVLFLITGPVSKIVVPIRYLAAKKRGGSLQGEKY